MRTGSSWMACSHSVSIHHQSTLFTSRRCWGMVLVAETYSTVIHATLPQKTPNSHAYPHEMSGGLLWNDPRTLTRYYCMYIRYRCILRNDEATIKSMVVGKVDSGGNFYPW